MRGRIIRLMLAIDGLGIGGAEMVVRDLARSLDREEFEVSICCTKGLGGAIGEQLRADGMDVFVLPGQRAGHVDYLTALKLRSAIMHRNIDVVHTHAPPAFTDAAVCKLMVPGLKLLHTFHYGNYPHLPWRTLWMEAVATRLANRLVAVGHEQRRRIESTFRLREDRINTVWNGVTLPPQESGASFRAEIGTGDRLLIGTIAKLIEQKGLDDLLSVAQRCRDAGPPMQFVIVGEGPLRNLLEQRRRELGLEDSVLLTGWVPNAAAHTLPAFDVFFQPSRWEAMSIAVLEAMASSKAIVATRVGDNPYVLDDEVSGLLVEPGDIDGMARALGRLSDEPLRARLGMAARASFGERFSIGHMVRAYTDIYRELVRDRGALS